MKMSQESFTNAIIPQIIYHDILEKLHSLTNKYRTNYGRSNCTFTIIKQNLESRLISISYL